MLNVFWGMKPKDEPVRPEAVAILKQRANVDFTTSRCLPGGIPASLFISSFKIVQAPDQIVMLMEDGDPARQIHTDGRSLPRDPQPAWMGYSVGDFGHMDLEITIEDPKYYTQPYTFRTQLNLIAGGDVLEFVCMENEKDQVHAKPSAN